MLLLARGEHILAGAVAHVGRVAWTIEHNVVQEKYGTIQVAQSWGCRMPITTKDVISLSEARSRLSEIADEVRAGSEKVITKNGQSYVALIDADRLDYYHRLEQERIHLLLLEEASKGLDDVANGKVKDARQVLRRLTARRRTA